MKYLTIPAAILAATLLLSGFCQGQEVSIILKDGQTFVGEVLDVSADSVKVKYKTADGEKNGTFRIADLEVHSAYSILRQAAGDDAKAQLELAKFCMYNNMFTACIAHYHRAKDLDPAFMEKFDREEKPRLKENWAAKLLAKAERHIEKKKWEEAEEELSTILTYLFETKAADKARALILEVGQEKVKQGLARVKEAEAETGMELVDLLLEDGTTIRGEIVDSTEDSVRIKTKRGPGMVTVTLAADKLDPFSFCRARFLAVKDDPAGLIGLARFCVMHNSFVRAFFYYETAKMKDPQAVAEFEQNELPGLREDMAADFVKEARAAIDDGRYADAGRSISTVLARLDDTAAAKDALALVDQLEGAFKKWEAGQVTAAVQNLEESEKAAAEERLKLIEPARKEIERAQKLNHQALKEENKGKARTAFVAAGDRFKKACEILDGLKKKHAEDPQAVALIESYRREAADEGISAYGNAGSISIMRNSFKDAYDLADKMFEIDPDSSYAHSYRSRVELASAAASGEGRRGNWRRR